MWGAEVAERVPISHDVAIIGSGFAGSILARILCRQGKKVLLLERESHPRFALGESSTPLANLALERIAARYDLPDLHHLATYGRWMRHLPHLRRGLKRGFTFFDHRRGEPFRNSGFNEARLMVAASPEDRLADTHWLREDVDHHLVQKAEQEGVDYRELTRVTDLKIDEDSVLLTVQGAATQVDRKAEQVRVDRVVDASGAGGVVARSLDIPFRVEQTRIDTGLLFAHFENVKPLEEVATGAILGGGPYPEHQAAVHHILDDGWMYQLPFDHGVTSAGWVLRNDRLALDPAALTKDPTGAWQYFLSEYPTVEAQFAKAQAITRIRYVPRLQYQFSRSAGPRWFLLPQAYCFFDPLFSVGMAWSLNAVERLGDLFDNGLETWRSYSMLLSQEADQVRYLIEAAYAGMDDFEHFTAVSLLYFASVSYSEMQQRLTSEKERSAAWSGFLGARDPVVQSLLVQSRDRLLNVGGNLEDFSDWVRRRIEPRDIAGLASPSTPNLYPVNLDLLIERSHLLGLEPEEIVAALPRLRGELDV